MISENNISLVHLNISNYLIQENKMAVTQIQEKKTGTKK